MAEYCKYAYWTDSESVARLKTQLAAEGLAAVEAKKTVCVPMSRRVDIGVVPPETWRNNELCRRPLSWYWASPFAGRHLLISAFDLDRFGFQLQIVLRSVKFKPPSLPGDAEKLAMIGRSSYLDAKPDEWDDLDQTDPAEQDRWMKALGIRHQNFRELFVTHCANHANFIEPAFFLEENGDKIPYSIGKTNQICSACLEFFGVLGNGYPKKRVVPCPGAVIYAGLPVNRYIEVETFGDPS